MLGLRTYITLRINNAVTVMFLNARKTITNLHDQIIPFFVNASQRTRRNMIFLTLKMRKKLFHQCNIGILQKWLNCQEN